MLPASLASEPSPPPPGLETLVGDAAFIPGDPIVTGRVIRMRLTQEPSLSYYLYLPKKLRQPARLFVTVHGISRNAREHAKRFAPYAEEEGVILIAPAFKRKLFPGYQRLNENEAGLSPDSALDQIVEEVRLMTGNPDSKLYLFGFSGGGQFVHRYLMRYPQRVAKAAIGAAGWYTFPDSKVKYPRGLKRRTDDPQPSVDPDLFLQVPVSVLVGDLDTQRDEALNTSPRIDKQQGGNRLERGRRWIEAMQASAQARGYETEYRFLPLPGVGHDFTDAMVIGNMGELVFNQLFRTRPSTDCGICPQRPSLISANRITTEHRP